MFKNLYQSKTFRQWPKQNYGTITFVKELKPATQRMPVRTPTEDQEPN